MVQVRVHEGILEGEEVTNKYDNGKTFFSFKGIPYAQPPVGNLRFKAPEPCRPWKGVRSAKSFGSKCYQYDMFGHQPIGGSEDCLYLNVYTPSLSPSEPLPVMIWIHGGGFVSGSGDDDWYGPEYLLKKGVILVTINYRLEVLGFLCLDTEEVPGNAGMKDQVAAMRWVNRNIQNFGGDPNNVTIFGESAGAGSIGYHLVSPMTKGLFKKAILQSGSMTCWWSYVMNAKERAVALATHLGFKSENDEELYDFFKALPVDSLVMQQNNTAITFSQKQRAYEPACLIVDEKKFGDNERFFYGDFSYDNFAINIHEGVEVVVGFTKDEGLIYFTVGSAMANKFNDMSSFLEEFVPKPIAYKCNILQQLEAGKKIKDFYFKKRNISGKDWETVVNFYSDEMVLYGIIQLAKIIATQTKNNVYLYQFSCLSKRNQFVEYLGFGSTLKDKPVVVHCEDLLYLSSGKTFENDNCHDPEVVRLIDEVTTMWTNFAKYGNPTSDENLGVQWPTYTLEKQEYLDIGNQLEIKTAPYHTRMELWESIFSQYAPEFVCKTKY